MVRIFSQPLDGGLGYSQIFNKDWDIQRGFIQLSSQETSLVMGCHSVQSCALLELHMLLVFQHSDDTVKRTVHKWTDWLMYMTDCPWFASILCIKIMTRFIGTPTICRLQLLLWFYSQFSSDLINMCTQLLSKAINNKLYKGARLCIKGNAKRAGLAGRCTDRVCILGPAHGWFNFMELSYCYVDFLFALAHVCTHTRTVATEHAPSHNALTQQSVFFKFTVYILSTLYNYNHFY